MCSLNSEHCCYLHPLYNTLHCQSQIIIWHTVISKYSEVVFLGWRRYVLLQLMPVCCCVDCIVQPEADGQILTYPMSATLSDTHAGFVTSSPYNGPTQHPGPPSFSSVVYGSGQPDVESEWSSCTPVYLSLLWWFRLGLLMITLEVLSWLLEWDIISTLDATYIAQTQGSESTL